MPKQYSWSTKPLPKEEAIRNLSDAINTNPIVSTILIQRGITTFGKAKSFFRPSLEQLHNPLLMKDMDKAVGLIHAAIKKNEQILIYGDYDVDGTTSVALFLKYLRQYYSNVLYYIPDRYQEGYGVSLKGVEWAAEEKVSLIISVDCGIRGFEPIARAKELGMQFIVCDHHTPDTQLPVADAILDPKQKHCSYPFKELPGCGVGFKLLQALAQAMNWPDEPLFNLLDLVSVSIAADIVPVTGENRILAYLGMKQLNRAPSIGLAALIKVAGLAPPLSISNVVFGLAPRINASGRIEHANLAVELLIAENEEVAARMATSLNEKNLIRRETQEQITKEALAMVEDSAELKKRKSTVLFKADWHKGVIGIVASKCVDTYYKPTIILTESNGMLTGSARSVAGYNVFNAIEKTQSYVSQFGGHKYAAGLSLRKENFALFSNAFEKEVAATILPEQEQPTLKIDSEITLDLINYKFLNIINQMEPFGPGNMQPLFVAYNVLVQKAVLLKEKHIKLNVTQNGAVFDSIGFNMPEFYANDLAGKAIDIVFQVTENNFRGIKSIQLMLKDIKFTD